MLTTRLDPTRTSMLRHRCAAQMVARFRSLQSVIMSYLGSDDAFGLDAKSSIITHAEPQYTFLTDDAKIKAFRRWLQQQVDAKILTTDRNSKKPWTDEFVISAYKRGVVNAWLQANRPDLVKNPGAFYTPAEQNQKAFLTETFNQHETLRKLQLAYTRMYTQLDGITAAQDGKLSAIFASALANGLGSIETARQINKEVDGIGIKRSVLLARTELIHDHAEGQLDSFERLGADELDLEPEWTTTSYKPCPRCLAKAGTQYTISEARGLIPLHPLCQCIWKLKKKRKS